MRLSAAWKAANPNHPHVKNPPPKRRRPRKLSTSEAAIRRFEQRKRGGTGSTRGKPLPGRGPRKPTPTPRKPWGRQGGPRADARPTGGGRRTSVTSRAAIGRSRSRLGRGGRVAGSPARGTRRR